MSPRADMCPAPVAALCMPRARMVFEGRVQIKAAGAMAACCAATSSIPSRDCYTKLLVAVLCSDVLATDGGLCRRDRRPVDAARPIRTQTIGAILLAPPRAPASRAWLSSLVTATQRIIGPSAAPQSVSVSAASFLRCLTQGGASRWDPPHLMTQLGDLPAPEMRAATAFQCDDTSRQLAEKRQNPDRATPGLEIRVLPAHASWQSRLMWAFVSEAHFSSISTSAASAVPALAGSSAAQMVLICRPMRLRISALGAWWMAFRASWNRQRFQGAAPGIARRAARGPA